MSFEVTSVLLVDFTRFFSCDDFRMRTARVEDEDRFRAKSPRIRCVQVAGGGRVPPRVVPVGCLSLFAPIIKVYEDIL